VDHRLLQGLCVFVCVCVLCVLCVLCVPVLTAWLDWLVSAIFEFASFIVSPVLAWAFSNLHVCGVVCECACVCVWATYMPMSVVRSLENSSLNSRMACSFSFFSAATSARLS